MDILKSAVVWVGGVSLLILFFSISLIIWLLVLPFDKNRVVMHRILIWQSHFYKSLIPVRSYHAEGKEKAVRGTTYVIISNHQSILDILYMNSLGYNYKWISKIENHRVPFLGWYLSMADYISVDRGNEESKTEMLQNSLRCLKNGISIMIFPEGTRSLNGDLGFFKRGAFQLALEAKVPILPVVLDGTGGILPKHGLIFGTGHDVKLKVLDPVAPDNFGTDNPDELSRKFADLMKETLKKMRNQSGT